MNAIYFKKLKSGNYKRTEKVEEATEVLTTAQDFYSLIQRAAREGRKVIKATYRMSQTYYGLYDTTVEKDAKKWGLQ